MSRHLFFTTFGDANSFLKKIRIGKVQRKPNTDLFIWDSEYASLTEEHESMIEEEDGSKFVWTDPDIGLTWLFQDRSMPIERLNATSYGGHDDWRVPTLRELKTLSSNVKTVLAAMPKRVSRTGFEVIIYPAHPTIIGRTEHGGTLTRDIQQQKDTRRERSSGILRAIMPGSRKTHAITLRD